MDRYKRFKLETNLATASMRAAEHKAALALHDMEANPTEENIAAYERLLDECREARRRIGDINDAEMKQRDIDACRIEG